MKKLLFISLTLLFLLNGTIFAADWEWTTDKGWTQGAGKPRETPDEQLRYAWQLEEEKRFQSAAQQYFLLLKTWPDSEEASTGLQRLANCLFKLENYYDSFKALEQVIKSYPTSIKKNDLLKIEFLIGRKFQTGARKDMLNMSEATSVGLRTAIEIFEAIIKNDPVGPYSGAAHLAVADCYRKMGEARQAVQWYDRVLEQYSFSNELVAKAEVGKQLARVEIGEESVDNVKAKRAQLEEVIKNAEKVNEGAGNTDFSPVTDLKEEFNELNEREAEKLWKNAQFYNKRGTFDSQQAYKFTLEQLVIRYPNTQFASRARKEIGVVKVPDEEPANKGKINIPFVKKEPDPTFIAKPNDKDHVERDNVLVPGLSEDDEPIGTSVAGAVPANSRQTIPTPNTVRNDTTEILREIGVNNNTPPPMVRNEPAPNKAPPPSAPTLSQAQNQPRQTEPQAGGASAIPAGLRERVTNASNYRTPDQSAKAREVSKQNEEIANKNNWNLSDDFE